VLGIISEEIKSQVTMPSFCCQPVNSASTFMGLATLTMEAFGQAVRVLCKWVATHNRDGASRCGM
jgi:hypothetical protein